MPSSEKKTFVVTGGAGYIGSRTVRRLRERGYDTVVLDDLSEGHRAAVEGSLVVADFSDREALDEIFGRAGGVQGVVHFAANCYVGESVENPGKYYRNNLVKTLALLDAMVTHGVPRFVFSSTCATYGDPIRIPMDEQHPQDPINPYGATKLMVERALLDYGRAYDLGSVCLRYFNAAGADPDGEHGEDHEPETHLIPLAIQAALGKREELTIFGTDYPTPDGTCIRDYIHVTDLAEAHLLALEIEAPKDAAGAKTMAAFNLGTGKGASVREVVQAVKRVSGLEVPHVEGPRRAGDPPELVASGQKAAQELGWRPRHADLVEIVETAWRWHENHPRGYGDRSE